MLQIGRIPLAASALCVALPWWGATASVSGAQIQAGHPSEAREAATASFQKGDSPDKPLYSEYRGVRIGMSADDVRKSLGGPQDKGDDQDLFSFSEKESAQIFYDKSHKVQAISVDFLSASAAPTAKTVLGTDIAPKADGSMYKMVQYPKAGFWVCYNRTAGQTPLITITIQKIGQ